MKTKSSILYYVLFIIGIVILVNIIADKFFVRLDFTADKRYTLSQATKNIIDDVENPVTISAYFSENMPPHIAKTKTDFKEMLVEYANLSDGNIVYEFIDPNANEEAEAKAMQAGIQPVVINVREKDQVKQQKAFLGAVVQMGDQKDIIPFVQPGASMEYALSSSIKKLSVTNKPTIGFLQGHGEATISAMQQAQASLSVMYEVEHVTINNDINNLLKYKAVAIIAPKDSFPDSDLQMLDEYLAKGKSLFIAMNRVHGDFSTAQGSALTTNLETWLAKKGLTVENNFVIDQNCGSVSVQQQHAGFTFNTQVSFPYFPVISNFSDHPITEGLEAVLLQLASSITFTGDTTMAFTPIAKTSELSATLAAPLFFDINKQWSQTDFPLSELTVAAALSGKMGGNQNANIVVVADGDFAVNGEGQQAMQLNPDNVSLMVNAIDWLSDDTGLIELRTKGVTMRPLDQLDDATKTTLKYINFLLPIVLILVYGVFRMQRNRFLRIKRMEEGYV